MNNKINFKKTCIALAVAQAWSIGQVHAATMRVTIGTEDELNGCTFRNAVAAINSGANTNCSNVSSNGFGTNDTIEFDVTNISLEDGQITIESSNVDLTKHVDVKINPNGDRVTIFRSSSNNFRIFQINDSTVSFDNMSIKNGRINERGAGLFISDSSVAITSSTITGNSSTNSSGGGLYSFSSTITLTDTTVSLNEAGYGGGIHSSSGEIVLNDSAVSSNSAEGQGGGIFSSTSKVTLTNTTVSLNEADYGGGVNSSYGEIVLNDSTVSNNSAENNGGGIYNYTDSTLTLNDTDVINNSAEGRGGGIINTSGTVTLTNSRLSNNLSKSAGGGLANQATSSNVATATIMNSTISNNIAGLSGGGAHVGANGHLSIEGTALVGNTSEYGSGGALFLQSGQIEVTNSTISNNDATAGGGIFVYYYPTISTLSLLNTTISNNSASIFGGGIAAVGDHDASMTNTIISGNDSALGSHDIHASSNNSLTSNGFNLIGDGSVTSADSFNITLNPNDIIATSDSSQSTPLSNILEPLANSGGPTMTHALAAGSPAIDAANNALCAAAPINNRDQRGESRSDCDIGAYEFQQDTSSFFVIPLPNGKSVVIEL